MNDQYPCRVNGAKVIAYALVKPENTPTPKAKRYTEGNCLQAAKALLIVRPKERRGYCVFRVYDANWKTLSPPTMHDMLVDAIMQLEIEYLDLARNLIIPKHPPNAEER